MRYPATAPCAPQVPSMAARLDQRLHDPRTSAALALPVGYPRGTRKRVGGRTLPCQDAFLDMRFAGRDSSFCPLFA